MRTSVGRLSGILLCSKRSKKKEHGRNVYTITELNFVFTPVFSVTCIGDIFFIF